MKEDPASNQYAIIISKKVTGQIDLPGSCPYPVFTEEDIQGKALGLLQRNKEKRLWVLIFLPPEDTHIIDNFFRNFNYREIAYGMVIISTDKKETELPEISKSIQAVRTTRIVEREFSFLVEKSFSMIREEALLKGQQEARYMTLLDTQRDLEELIYIGKALSLEKDPEKLLRSILYQSKKITGADAGSIFLAEEGPEKEKRLRFKCSHTFSKDLPYEEFTMPLDSASIAGYVAVTGKVLNIPDVYSLKGDAPYSFNQSFDKKHGYRTKSILAVPMRNHLDDIIGVIQLINSKESQEKDRIFSGNEAFEVHLDTKADFDAKVVPFEARYESLMEAVASQAAIALENNRMIIQIEQEFDEFVKASVTAIESRDPATSGHSARVAAMSVRMAWAVNEVNTGVFKDVHFSDSELKELELAGLLHDFGKVYLDPNIFLKGNKLYPKDLSYLEMRLNFVHRTVELDCLRHQKSIFMGDGNGAQELMDDCEKKKSHKLANLLKVMELIRILNQPNLQQGDPEELIGTVDDLGRSLRYKDLEGELIPIMTDYERENFAIKRGSLNREERAIIESHVEHSYAFVSKIPWPPEYRMIPEIIANHHEKLDGSGYPAGLKGRSKIPIQARIMTIADIFDALTAPDRPYKKSVPLDRVLAILSEEAGGKKLDIDLIDLFIEKKLYEQRDSLEPAPVLPTG